MIARICYLVLIGMGLDFMGTALAGTTTTCEPEPTDMSISYGDFIDCDIEISGESDTYRAYFNIGDGVRLEATNTEAVSFFMTVFDPTGQEIFHQLVTTTGFFYEIISTAGIYTLVVQGSSASTGTYSIQLTCVGGTCLPIIVPDMTTGSGVSVSGAYVTLDITNGSAPPVNNCQDDRHYGRMVVDDVNSILYVCDQTGWTAH